MPDWSYQTVFRPLLFSMQPPKGRDFALGFMGRLAGAPLGRNVIRFMGHMAPDARLQVEKQGLKFPAPSGLGADLDPQLLGTRAFGEFGFGFVEIGPIRAERASSGAVRVENESIQLEAPTDCLTPIETVSRLERHGGIHPVLIARIEPEDQEQARVMIEMLESMVDAFSIPLDLVPTLPETSLPVLVIIPAASFTDEASQRLATALENPRCVGVIVANAGDEKAGKTFAPESRPAALQLLRDVRSKHGDTPLVIGAVAIHAPDDALDYFEAGADLVQVDSGMVFAGPGLPKRINEAVLYRRLASDESSGDVVGRNAMADERVGGYSWFWALLMGLAMAGGGALALLIAATGVVLSYDEAMSGLTREKLMSINSKLLPFMAHDRVTLAGTMLAVGIQYSALAWWGIRRGIHWAYVSVIFSAFTGFFGFFSFLRFGYFDPFHAFVTAVLFQFLLLTIHSKLDRRNELTPPDLWNNATWRRCLWGQLMFVIHGAVLIVAGSVILKVGMTSVFVHEDLEFMQTTADSLHAAHPRLTPLVAHDRATFGGMLIACGIATLLPALWGFRRGQNWLWWALVIAGSIAYLATILIHWIVGYTSLKHLLPAYGGLLWLWVSGALSFSHLVGQDDSLEAAWRKRLASEAEQ